MAKKKKKSRKSKPFLIKNTWKTKYSYDVKKLADALGYSLFECINQDWSAEDQALWVAALDIVRLMEEPPGDYPQSFEMIGFATLWRNELLLG